MQMMLRVPRLAGYVCQVLDVVVLVLLKAEKSICRTSSGSVLGCADPLPSCELRARPFRSGEVRRESSRLFTILLNRMPMRNTMRNTVIVQQQDEWIGLNGCSLTSVVCAVRCGLWAPSRCLCFMAKNSALSTGRHSQRRTMRPSSESDVGGIACLLSLSPLLTALGSEDGGPLLRVAHEVRRRRSRRSRKRTPRQCSRWQRPRRRMQWGRDPRSGWANSDRKKLLAGVLQKWKIIFTTGREVFQLLHEWRMDDS